MRKTGWHAQSWNRCLDVGLPELLASRMPVASYTRDRGAGTILLGVVGAAGSEIRRLYESIPEPDSEGVFIFRDREVVVVPRATDEGLAHLELCGEQLLGFLDERIGEAPSRYFTDGEALSAWAPLSELVTEFFLERSQVQDDQNELARITHLNRIIVDSPADIASPLQLGKVCPVETPEGPNIGRVLTVASGASIVDGRLVSSSDSPGSGLGPVASMIPFLERTDPARALMGANMMRQWILPENGEEPLVITGNEPAGAASGGGFRLGFNLLTAFVSLGAGTSDGAIVLGRSAANRMHYGSPVSIGDKLSNRHGTKGVVSEIREDRLMPRLEDGTPVELVLGVAALHTEMNTGQLFEALAGRVAMVSGTPYEAPPFASRSRSDFRAELEAHGLPSDGLEQVYIPSDTGDGGTQVATVCGWIYWGLTVHIARDKIRSFVAPESGQRLGAMEYWILRDAGCNHLITETIGMRASDHPEAVSLPERIASGEIPSPTGDSQPLRRLAAILRGGGISVSLGEDRLEFGFSEEGGYALARAVNHPWLPSRTVSSVPEDRAPADLRRENERLRHLIDSRAPESIVSKSHARLVSIISDYMNGLFSSPTNDCLPTGSSLFSGRSVIVPSASIDFDRIGIPEEMAWTLFGPMVSGGSRDPRHLDEVLDRSWVAVNHAPSFAETAVIGFRPLRVAHQAIELSPLVLRWLAGDFDGDQVAVFVPISEEARSEVAERLSVVGQIERDPSRVVGLLPPAEALWGLSFTWMQPEGRARIESILGVGIDSAGAELRSDELAEAFSRALESHGARGAVTRIEEIMRLGFAASRFSGAISPFVPLPAAEDLSGPDSDAIVREAFESRCDYSEPGIGAQLLYVKAGIRGRIDHLVKLAFRRSAGSGAASLLDGIAPTAYAHLALEVRRELAGFLLGDISSINRNHTEEQLSRATTVLARAARAKRRGVVFASAAARGEFDPLTDPDSRLFVGMMPKARGCDDPAAR